MRILTKRQYDAICDIVTEKDNKIKELEAEIAKKDKTIDYLNDKLSKRNREFICYIFKNTPMVHIASIDDLDFPATTKQPEDKLF